MSEPADGGESGWTELWGINGDRAELESAMSLVPGRYTSQRTAESVVLPDPHYPTQSQRFAIELLTDAASGQVWKFGLTEITNGVYALIYQTV